ncbi:TTAGGG repeat binding factor [Mycoemilia scoparia]|uniref:TTAGGG repeat binding factor n=1 Tax=Mycoemilia scoparia TaxID=417184 RepID=A0A9W8DUP9_9FUNG|nr:TTAGGG repeat binding factor [Mycoemilia scoparia]
MGRIRGKKQTAAVTRGSSRRGRGTSPPSTRSIKRSASSGLGREFGKDKVGNEQDDSDRENFESPKRGRGRPRKYNKSTSPQNNKPEKYLSLPSQDLIEESQREEESSQYSPSTKSTDNSISSPKVGKANNLPGSNSKLKLPLMSDQSMLARVPPPRSQPPVTRRATSMLTNKGHKYEQQSPTRKPSTQPIPSRRRSSIFKSASPSKSLHDIKSKIDELIGIKRMSGVFGPLSDNSNSDSSGDDSEFQFPIPPKEKRMGDDILDKSPVKKRNAIVESDDENDSNSDNKEDNGNTNSNVEEIDLTTTHKDTTVQIEEPSVPPSLVQCQLIDYEVFSALYFIFEKYFGENDQTSTLIQSANSSLSASDRNLFSRVVQLFKSPIQDKQKGLHKDAFRELIAKNMESKVRYMGHELMLLPDPATTGLGASSSLGNIASPNKALIPWYVYKRSNFLTAYCLLHYPELLRSNRDVSTRKSFKSVSSVTPASCTTEDLSWGILKFVEVFYTWILPQKMRGKEALDLIVSLIALHLVVKAKNKDHLAMLSKEIDGLDREYLAKIVDHKPKSHEDVDDGSEEEEEDKEYDGNHAVEYLMSELLNVQSILMIRDYDYVKENYSYDRIIEAATDFLGKIVVKDLKSLQEIPTLLRQQIPSTTSSANNSQLQQSQQQQQHCESISHASEDSLKDSSQMDLTPAQREFSFIEGASSALTSPQRQQQEHHQKGTTPMFSKSLLSPHSAKPHQTHQQSSPSKIRSPGKGKSLPVQKTAALIREYHANSGIESLLKDIGPPDVPGQQHQSWKLQFGKPSQETAAAKEKRLQEFNRQQKLKQEKMKKAKNVLYTAFKTFMSAFEELSSPELVQHQQEIFDAMSSSIENRTTNRPEEASQQHQRDDDDGDYGLGLSTGDDALLSPLTSRAMGFSDESETQTGNRGSKRALGTEVSSHKHRSRIEAGYKSLGGREVNSRTTPPPSPPPPTGYGVASTSSKNQTSRASPNHTEQVRQGIRDSYDASDLPALENNDNDSDGEWLGEDEHEPATKQSQPVAQNAPPRPQKSQYHLDDRSPPLPRPKQRRKRWTKEEEDCLIKAIENAGGPSWSYILSLHGPDGTESRVLAHRDQVALKDKARVIKLHLWNTGQHLGVFWDITGKLNEDKRPSGCPMTREEEDEQREQEMQEQED